MADEKMTSDIYAIYNAESLSIAVERESRRYRSFSEGEVGE